MRSLLAILLGAAALVGCATPPEPTAAEKAAALGYHTPAARHDRDRVFD